MKHSITYSLSPSVDGKYIVVHIKGEVDRHNTMPVTIEAHELAAGLGIRGILVDATEARSVRSPVDVYEYIHADVLRSPKILRFAQIALLVSPDDHSHDFLETVCLNANFNVRIFKDRQKAIDYLVKPSAPLNLFFYIQTFVSLSQVFLPEFYVF